MASDPEAGGRGRQLLNSIGTLLQKARRDSSPFARGGESPHSGTSAVGAAGYEAVLDGSGSPDPSSGGQLQWQQRHQQQAAIQRQLDSAKAEFQQLQSAVLTDEDSYAISSAVQETTAAGTSSPAPAVEQNSQDADFAAAVPSVGPAVSKKQSSQAQVATAAANGAEAQLAAALAQLAGRDQQVEVLMQQVKRLSNYVDASMEGSQEAEVQTLNQKLLERSAELSSTQDQLVAVVEAKAQLQRQVSALKLLLSDQVHECAAMAKRLASQQEVEARLTAQLADAIRAAEAAAANATAAAEESSNARAALAAAQAQVQQLEAATQAAYLESHAAALQGELDMKAKALDNGAKAAAQSVQREQDMVWLLAVRDETIAAQARCITSMEQQLEGCQLQVQELRALVQMHEQNGALFADPAALGSSSSQSAVGEGTANTGGTSVGSSGSTVPPATPPAATTLTGAARAWLHSKEHEQLVKLKDELKERDKAVKELTAATARMDNQLHGLKTALVAKGAQCNRLDVEARQAENKLRACQAAAAAEADALRCALSDAISEAARLRSSLEARCAREAVLVRELAIARGQIQDLLDALQADAKQLLLADPAECTRVRAESACILAEVAAAHSRPAGGDVDIDLHSLLGADRSMSLSSWEAVSYPSTSVTRAGSSNMDAAMHTAGGSSAPGRAAAQGKPSAFDSVKQTIMGKLREWDDSNAFVPGSSPGKGGSLLQPFMSSGSSASTGSGAQPSAQLPGSAAD